MNHKEHTIIEQLQSTIQRLIEENAKFRTEMTQKNTEVLERSEKIRRPVELESDILKVAQKSIADAIQTAMSHYDSPLVKLVASVIDENQSVLREIISSSFGEVISTENFKQSIVSAFSHKVARSIISNNDGLFEKVSNDLKQDAVFKSKMALAVANVVEECLTNRG